MKLKELFPDGLFNNPAAMEAIKTAEEELGVKFPKQLVDLYLETDGFREDLGNSEYLKPLFDLISLTKFFWYEDYMKISNFNNKDFIFFGSNGCNTVWGINYKKENEIIGHDHLMEGEAEFLGETILEVYKNEFALFIETINESFNSIIPEPFLTMADTRAYKFFRSKGIPVTEGDFQDEAGVFKTQIKETFDGAKSDAGRKITSIKDEKLTGESYKLGIEPASMTIRAGTGAGAYRAFQVIRQLLLSENTIPCASIEDKPRFAWRGFMLDTARHFYSVAFIKKLIDALSMHHINIFHWHLTDDQGWRLPIPEYPLLTEIGSKRRERRRSGEPYIGGFYTESDIKEIVAFAAERHVEVVPELDLPGHASAILASYPGLGCTGGPYRVEDRFGIFEDVLCAGNDGIFDLAEAVFNTLARLFPSKYVHIGGDEVRFNRWEHCPKCQKRLEETGLSKPRELQSWITVKLAEMLAEKGKTAIGWDEVLEDSEKYPLPKEVVVMSWRGAEGGKAAVKRGHPVIMSPSDKGCYLDYRNADENEEPGQYGVSTAFQAYTVDPLEDMTQAESSLVLGSQCNLWSELIYAGKIAEYMIFPRIAAFAENVWSSPNKKDFTDFERRLVMHRARLDKLGIAQYRGKLR